MAFPDDYRRVQIAGGIQADVASHLGLPRQLLVDTTNLNLRLMDGVTPGGHRVQMVKDLDANIQVLNDMEGEVEYVETGTDTPGQVDQRRRLWKASKLRNLMLKFADITLVGSTYVWSVKNAFLPIRIRTNATLVTDPNLSTMSGWSRVLPGSVNMPKDAPSAGSLNLMLEVISQGESDLVQILYSRDGAGKIWIRSRAEGVWADWILVTGLTSADLHSRIAKTGDSMTGKLTLAASTNGRAALNLLAGDYVDTPADGDIWRHAATGLLFQKGGVTRTILDSDNAFGYVKDNAGAVGIGQSTYYVSGSRTHATPYQNVTAKTILVSVSANANSGNNTIVSIDIGPSPGMSQTLFSYDLVPHRTFAFSALVPPGWYYRIERSHGLSNWDVRELK